jgi:arsenate reductase
MAKARPYRVLFLCTGNSARSILAESVLARLGAGRFVAYSAGSSPKGAVHALALELLEHEGYPTQGLRSKSWDEFDVPGAPALDLVITVCDHAAGEVCPVWPGRPLTAHWGLPDPATVDGTPAERKAAFAATLEALRRRIGALVELPIESMDRMSVKRSLDAIGRL